MNTSTEILMQRACERFKIGVDLDNMSVSGDTESTDNLGAGVEFCY